jgi:hypothetical protein
VRRESRESIESMDDSSVPAQSTAKLKMQVALQACTIRNGSVYVVNGETVAQDGPGLVRRHGCRYGTWKLKMGRMLLPDATSL